MNNDNILARSLTVRYVIGLLLVATLSTTAWISFHLLIIAQESTAALVNISGRQRMLSQRIALITTTMTTTHGDPSARAFFRERLQESAKLMRVSNQGLTHGDSALSLPRSMSKEVGVMYFAEHDGVDQLVEDYLDLVDRFLSVSDANPAAAKEIAVKIREAAFDKLLLSLDRLVSQYQLEGEQAVRKLNRIETLMWAMTLILLLGEALFIFRPFSGRLRSVVGQLEETRNALQQAKDGLEESVMLKTRELSRKSQELKKLSRAVEQNPNSIVIAGPDEKIEFVNQAFIQRTGYAASDVVGLRLSQFAAAEMPGETFRAIKTTLDKNETWRGEVVNKTKDGQQIIESVTLFPVFDDHGELTNYLSINEDITAVKKLLAEVSKYRDHLESEVRSRTLELVQARDLAEQANRAKSDFLSNMSHEIRSPMSAILGLSYLLEQADLPEAAAEKVVKIRIAGRTLLGIINDILDVSKIESGMMELECAPFRLSELLIGLSTMMSANASRKDLDLSISSPHEVEGLVGDALRLGQILINLTSNAIKFTTNGHVLVSIQLLGIANGLASLRFSVIDTGVGISPDVQEKIFLPFSQADTSITRQYGGSGLGLTICQQLLSLMGTKLNVKSAPGKGSEFWFEIALPLVDLPQLSAPEMTNLDILIVDDNETCLRALQNEAQSLGWRVNVADSGEAALAQIQDKEVRPGNREIILLDWKMPVTDGLTTAKIIRKIRPADDASLIIIMATAYSMDKLESDPNRKYADAVLNKPVTSSSLYDVVAKIFAQKNTATIHCEKTHKPKLEGIRILVVDDSEINCEVAEQIFSSEGATVRVVNDGQQALDWLHEYRDDIDIVLMDVQMPVLDGYEATRRIRADPSLASLPVIALTAGAFEAQQEAARESGMNDFLSKPFDIEQTIKCILKHISASSGQKGGMSGAAAVVVPDNGSDYPGLDLARGRKLWKDENVYKTYLLKFVTDFQPDIEALAQLDSAQCAAWAHKLSGAAANLALVDLAAVASTMEQTARSNEDWHPLVSRMHADFTLASASIKRFTSDGVSPAPSATVVDQALVHPLLLRIRGAFEHYDPTSAEPLVDALAPYIPTASLASLQTAILNFDSALGLQIIDELISTCEQ